MKNPIIFNNFTEKAMNLRFYRNFIEEKYYKFKFVYKKGAYSIKNKLL